MRLLLKILALLLCSNVYASDPPLTLYDEGSKQGVIFNINCTGGGITCSKSSTTGTLNVAGGGAATAGGNSNELQWNQAGSLQGTPRTVGTTTGNIGIGTTAAPTGNLELTKFSTTDLFNISTVGNHGDILKVANGGNVGIGSLSPGTSLDVTGAIRASGNITGLNLSGTNTGDQTDATLTFSDITTNNSSTSNHGFLLKLDNNAAHFMNGQGAWATPSGGSGTINSGTTNRFAYYSGATTLDSASPLYFNGTNIGIGTSTAGKLLTIGSTGQATIDSAGTATFPNTSAGSLNATTGTFTGLIDGNSGAQMRLRGGSPENCYLYTPSNMPKTCSTSDNNTTANWYVATNTGGQSLTVTLAGNVGIGTVGPTHLLGVGTADAFSVNSSGNIITTGTLSVTGHDTLEGVTSTGATGTGKFVFDGTPTLVTPILGVATGTSLTTSGNIGIGTTLITTAGLSVMRGNVGIGTWVPAGALHVVGTGDSYIGSGNLGIGSTTPGQLLDVFTSAGNGVRMVGIGTTVPQQLCITNGKIGYFNGTWASSCTTP